MVLQKSSTVLTTLYCGLTEEFYRTISYCGLTEEFYRTISYCGLTEELRRTTSSCDLTEDFYFILWSYRRLLLHTVVLWKSSTVLATSYCGLTELVHTVVLQKRFTVLTTSYCGLTELVPTAVLQKSSTVLATSYYGLAELVPTAVLQKSSTVLTTSYCGLTELVHTAVLQKSSTVLTCSAVSIRVNPLVPAQQHGLAEGDRPPVHHDRAQNAEEAVRVVGLLLDLGPYLAAPAAHEEDGAGPEGQALARQLQRLALVHPQLRLRFVHVQGHVVPLVELCTGGRWGGNGVPG